MALVNQLMVLSSVVLLQIWRKVDLQVYQIIAKIYADAKAATMRSWKEIERGANVTFKRKAKSHIGCNAKQTTMRHPEVNRYRNTCQPITFTSTLAQLSLHTVPRHYAYLHLVPASDPSTIRAPSSSIFHRVIRASTTFFNTCITLWAAIFFKPATFQLPFVPSIFLKYLVTVKSHFLYSTPASDKSCSNYGSSTPSVPLTSSCKEQPTGTASSEIMPHIHLRVYGKFKTAYPEEKRFGERYNKNWSFTGKVSLCSAKHIKSLLTTGLIRFSLYSKGTR